MVWEKRLLKRNWECILVDSDREKEGTQSLWSCEGTALVKGGRKVAPSLSS